MTDWTDAACDGHPNPDLWWPELRSTNNSQTDPWDAPRTICNTCPIQPECLTKALATPEPDGMWGAHTPTQRQTIQQGLGTPTRLRPAQHSVAAYRTGKCRCPICTEHNRRYQARHRTRVA